MVRSYVNGWMDGWMNESLSRRVNAMVYHALKPNKKQRQANSRNPEQPSAMINIPALLKHQSLMQGYNDRLCMSVGCKRPLVRRSNENHGLKKRW